MTYPVLSNQNIIEIERINEVQVKLTTSTESHIIHGDSEKVHTYPDPKYVPQPDTKENSIVCQKYKTKWRTS